MPGFCKRLKVNQGIHIEGGENTIDVVILDIYKEGDNKQVFFRVDGMEGLEKFTLDYVNSDMEDIPGVRVCIAERTSKRQGRPNRGRNVSIVCFADDGYTATRRDYPVK